MFNALIVATRPGTTPDRAVQVAAKLAQHAGLPVEAITVVRSRRNEPGAQPRHPALPQGADRLTVLHGDDVVTEIIEHVRNRDGALLVMTTGATALLSLQRQSVTSRVLAELRQPVLFLGPETAGAVPPTRATLVIGVDRNLDSQPALPVVESWRQSFAARTPRLVDIIPTSAWPADVRDRAAELAGLDAIVTEFGNHGIDAAVTVLHGNEPVDALLDVAAEVPDPVFVMTSGRWAGGRSHWYSTTRQLLRRSPWPVLIVPNQHRS